MYRKLIIFITLVISTSTFAQEGVHSPYSFFGIGKNTFKGTVENRSMGGLSSFSDSIHLNLQNPAAYGDLKLTTFTGGMTIESTDYESNSTSENYKHTTIDYFALGIPTKIGGFGLGLKPYSSVGYNIRQSTEDRITEFMGKGGLNTVYLSWGHELIDNLKIGATANFNFGIIENRARIFINQAQYASRDLNKMDIEGFSFNFGAMYDYALTEKIDLRAAVRYNPAASIRTRSERRVGIFRLAGDGSENIRDEVVYSTNRSDIEMPEISAVSLGIGTARKWFVGLEYINNSAGDYNSLSFNAAEDVNFTAANEYKLGGFFIPRYNDPSKYFKRVTYRAGIRFQDTGLNLRGEQINEYGISFGLGLPAGRFFTNANIGFEYGKRGTTSSNLVEEDFFSVFLNFSFSDKWFVERKYN
ncbi:MAG: lipid outer membrane transport protein FadL-like protein [Bacteroidota bacterium]